MRGRESLVMGGGGSVVLLRGGAMNVGCRATRGDDVIALADVIAADVTRRRHVVASSVVDDGELLQVMTTGVLPTISRRYSSTSQSTSQTAEFHSSSIFVASS